MQSHSPDFLLSSDQFVSPKAVWRGPGRPKLMSPKSSKQNDSKKERLPTFCGPQNWQTSSCLYNVDTNSNTFCTTGTFANFGLNFSHQLAKPPRGQNVSKRTSTPLNLGGFSNMIIHDSLENCEVSCLLIILWRKKRLRQNMYI